MSAELRNVTLAANDMARDRACRSRFRSQCSAKST